MKLLSEQKALLRLAKIKSDLKSEISANYEHRAKSCLTCETRGACCLDAHFVNVHVSRLEAVAISNAINELRAATRAGVHQRVTDTVEKYGLRGKGDTFAKTYACPLFEKGVGCLVHNAGKPVPCIQHACYENAADLPPDSIGSDRERLIDDLNRRTYGRSNPLLPLPVAIQRSS